MSRIICIAFTAVGLFFKKRVLFFIDKFVTAYKKNTFHPLKHKTNRTTKTQRTQRGLFITYFLSLSEKPFKKGIENAWEKII